MRMLTIATAASIVLASFALARPAVSASPTSPEKAGQVTIDAQFAAVHSFSGGLAAASRDGKSWGFINTAGTMVIPAVYTQVGDFVGGYAPVKSVSSMKAVTWSIINSAGKRTAGPYYVTAINNFSSGLAAYQVKKKNGYFWGLINPVGHVVVAPNDLLIRPYSEGLAAFLDYRGALGYMNTAGKIVIAPKLVESVSGKGTSDFHGGLALASKTGILWGYINKAGVFVIAPKYTLAGDFSNGIAPVYTYYYSKTIRRWGFINAKGAYTVKPNYVDVMPYRENVAWAKNLAGKWTLLNLTGTTLYSTGYEMVRSFSSGYAAFATSTGWGFINKAGTVVVDPVIATDPDYLTYIDSMDFAGGYAAVQSYSYAYTGYKWGFLRVV